MRVTDNAAGRCSCILGNLYSHCKICDEIYFLKILLGEELENENVLKLRELRRSDDD